MLRIQKKIRYNKPNLNRITKSLTSVNLLIIKYKYYYVVI